MLGADDFQYLKNWFNGEGIEQDEQALLNGLDGDEACKTLAYGKLRISDIGMTTWFGIRPCDLELTSGMARRFTFSIYFPSRGEAETIRKLYARSEIVSSNIMEEPEPFMAQDMVQVYDHIKECGSDAITEDCLSEFYDWCDPQEIPHFEENVLRSIAIGHSVVEGTYPRIKMTSDLKGLLSNELLNRRTLRDDWSRLMFHKILSNEPDMKIEYDELLKFMVNYLQFRTREARQLLMKANQAKTISFHGSLINEKQKTVELLYHPEEVEE